LKTDFCHEEDHGDLLCFRFHWNHTAGVELRLCGVFSPTAHNQGSNSVSDLTPACAHNQGSSSVSDLTPACGDGDGAGVVVAVTTAKEEQSREVREFAAANKSCAS
jgi:hypothetical protein